VILCGYFLHASNSFGWQIAGSVTGAVTHVVAAELGIGKAEKAAEKGARFCLNPDVLHLGADLILSTRIVGLPVVKESWLQASIDAGKPVTDKKHMLTEDGDDDGNWFVPILSLLRSSPRCCCV
jgi:hypothetical protein